MTACCLEKRPRLETNIWENLYTGGKQSHGNGYNYPRGLCSVKKEQDLEQSPRNSKFYRASSIREAKKRDHMLSLIRGI